MDYWLHLIDATGRHYCYDLNDHPLEVRVNSEIIRFYSRDNQIHEKFLELYNKLMVEKNSMCVITPATSIMLHADKILGLQLRNQPP